MLSKYVAPIIVPLFQKDPEITGTTNPPYFWRINQSHILWVCFTGCGECIAQVRIILRVFILTWIRDLNSITPRREV
jgi:hypothetical protein